jgi:hypothetical protein
MVIVAQPNDFEGLRVINVVRLSLWIAAGFAYSP